MHGEPVAEGHYYRCGTIGGEWPKQRRESPTLKGKK